MNDRAKGNKYEKEATEVLACWDLKSWRPQNASRRIQGGRYISFPQDIMGVYDVVAWDNSDMYLIQVKSDEGRASDARKAINAIGPPASCISVVLMRVKRKPFHFIAWVRNNKTDRWHRTKFSTEAKDDPAHWWDLSEVSA